MINEEILNEQIIEFEELKKITYSLKLPIEKFDEIIDYKIKKNRLVDNEKLINDFISKIRSCVQERSFMKIVDKYRTPIYKISNESINSTNYEYDYERTMKYRNLETKFHSKNLYLDGFTLFYRSGMATFTAIINLIFKFYKNISCVSHIGYYETLLVLEDNKKNIYNKNYNLNDKGICLNSDFYLLEFVKANFHFDILDLKSLLKNVNFDSNKLKFFVFDVSFLGDSFDMGETLKFFKQHKKSIIIFFRSGIKLDQQGLELINLGILSLYLTKDLLGIEDALLEFLQENRSRAGLSLNLMDKFTLEDIISIRDKNYSKKILANTSYFILQLNIKNFRFVDKVICSNVDYNNVDAYSTPYFFIKLKNATENDYINLCKLIKYEFYKEGLDVNFRTSFGFRNISFEYLKNKNVKDSEILKISPGIMKGYSYYKMINVLNDIFTNTYADFIKRCEEMLTKNFN